MEQDYSSASSSEEEDYQYYYNNTSYDQYHYSYYNYSNKPDWFTSLILLQADLIHNALSFLFSPVVFLLSQLSNSYHKAHQTTASVQSALMRTPSGVAHLARRLGCGLLGAAYACVALVVVLGIAVVLGVWLVRMWVDEPVIVRERLQFDYTEASPRAVFWVRRISSDNASKKKPNAVNGIPIGHSFHVSVVLLMPESGYNRDIGVFQIKAELLSTNGNNVMAKSSLPCMLHFRSLPIRLARTMLMSVPLLLGLSDETQKLAIYKILTHKEAYPRTEAIRVTISPRAGTVFLPQIYEAEIVLKSKIPWPKELVRRWKWTFYVWSSLYTFIVLVVTLLYFCKPVFFPLLLLKPRADRHELDEERDGGRAVLLLPSSEVDLREEEVTEYLRKWRLRRGKRKAMCLEEEMVGSPSAPSLTREETRTVEDEDEDDVGDSESVC